MDSAISHDSPSFRTWLGRPDSKRLGELSYWNVKTEEVLTSRARRDGTFGTVLIAGIERGAVEALRCPIDSGCLAFDGADIETVPPRWKPRDEGWISISDARQEWHDDLNEAVAGVICLDWFLESISDRVDDRLVDVKVAFESLKRLKETINLSATLDEREGAYERAAQTFKYLWKGWCSYYDPSTETLLAGDDDTVSLYRLPFADFTKTATLMLAKGEAPDSYADHEPFTSGAQLIGSFDPGANTSLLALIATGVGRNGAFMRLSPVEQDIFDRADKIREECGLDVGALEMTSRKDTAPREETEESVLHAQLSEVGEALEKVDGLIDLAEAYDFYISSFFDLGLAEAGYRPQGIYEFQTEAYEKIADGQPMEPCDYLRKEDFGDERAHVIRL